MSSETLEKARVAARAFGKDVSDLNLTILTETLEAHRQAEQENPTVPATPALEDENEAAS